MAAGGRVNEAIELTDIVLRVIGAFYAFAGSLPPARR